MDPRFEPVNWEQKLYALWEEKRLMTPPKKGEPYTILMPPPNANASLHAGHGMYVIDDIVVRYMRLQGKSSQWLPGMDHAGFETQYVYEKHLQKEGKSRLDFDRQTLYDNVYAFVRQNSGTIYAQFKRLGFLANWEKSVFTLDPHVIETVYTTFHKMIQDGYVYKDSYIVNYCVHCGTSLADLEVDHIERTDKLYYVRYYFVDAPDRYITVATVRPETIFIDTHLAVNPSDKKRKQLIGKKVKNPLSGEPMEIIGDSYADPKFGTGIVKLTPAHDANDFAVAKRHAIPVRTGITMEGRLTQEAGMFAGMKVRAARDAIEAKLQETGHIEKIDANYEHSVIACYKCKRDLEPMVVPNWFLRVDQLKERAIAAVKADKIAFHPKKYKQQLLRWYSIMHDWPISRQVAWGIRIPIWYSLIENPDLFLVFLDADQKSISGYARDIVKKYDSAIVRAGLQKVIAGPQAKWQFSTQPLEGDFVQETDTFDTWFSSGHWPEVTVRDELVKKLFPVDFLGTLADIVTFWVSRMIMFSLYLRDDIPFRNVYLWSMVADAKGQKMSKSKGNVINPIELVDKYGADAFRAALLFGVAQGSIVALSEDKVRAMRNFANKLWNMGRFISLQGEKKDYTLSREEQAVIKKLERDMQTLEKKYHAAMSAYQFSKAFDMLYAFSWHKLADYYIEALKEGMRNGSIEAGTALSVAYYRILVLLHPFMPFVTDAVWGIEHKGKTIIETDL